MPPSTERGVGRSGAGTRHLALRALTRDDAVMDAIALDSVDGGKLVFGRPRHLDRRRAEPWSFEATLAIAACTATAEVWEIGRGPSAFLRELADGWKGFEGVKSYESLENQLTLCCRHDGKGTIVCEASLGSVIPPSWQLTAELRFGAGAHLARLADEVSVLHRGTTRQR